jgi:hypothetical protein
MASLLIAVVGHSDIPQSPKRYLQSGLNPTRMSVKTAQVTSTIDEKKALDLVRKLPQVKRKSREIERLSRGSIRVSSAVESTPTADAPYYTVIVFEIHPNKSQDTIYWFRVLNPSGKIEVLDLVDNQYIPLETWKPDRR